MPQYLHPVLLQFLDSILNRIRVLDSTYTINTAEKQKIYIGLVKQFYINSGPLLDEKYAEEKKERILTIDIESKNVIKNGIQKKAFIYDNKLEIELNEILIELQQKLKKFFMPVGKDPSKAVADF